MASTSRALVAIAANPIAARYPLVEATTAVLFLGLAHFELFTGGANLPGGPDLRSSLHSILWHLRPELIAIYLYHLMLACTLLCTALIVWGRFIHRRKRLVIVALAIGFFVPLFLPMAHPVHAGLPNEWQRTVSAAFGPYSVSLFPTMLLESGIGLFVGGVLGAALAATMLEEPIAQADRRGVFAVAALIGTFLGWQTAISCALIAAAFSIVRPLLARWVRLPLTAATAASVVIQLPLWRSFGSLRVVARIAGLAAASSPRMARSGISLLEPCRCCYGLNPRCVRDELDDCISSTPGIVRRRASCNVDCVTSDN